MTLFWKWINDTKYMIFLAIMIVAFVTTGFILLRNQLSWYELTPEYMSFHRRLEPRAELFIPSPLEAHLLDSRDEFWPDTFNARNRFTPSRLPQLYSMATRFGRFDFFSRQELDAARERSILHATEHIEDLRSTLREVSENEIIEQEECSLMMQETLYRIAQAWPHLQNAVESYFHRCAPNGVHVLWWQLQRALMSEDIEKLNQAAQAFQLQINNFNGQWSRWFAMEAFQLGHIVSALIQERK